MTIQNLLTVDVEDWFHICGVTPYIPRRSWPDLESRVTENTSKILDMLDRYHVRATFFVLGYIAENHSDLVQQIQMRGHEIATHGYGHNRVYTLSLQMFRHDVRKAVDILTKITNHNVVGYRAPEWSIRDDSLWALQILEQEGMKYDSSMAPLPIIGNPRYPGTPYKHGSHQGSLWEFPPLVRPTSLVNLPLGGGWGLRVFPYRMVHAEIMRLNRIGQPALIYLHPREFDLHPPHIPLPWRKRFVLNAQIERTEKRLERLLNDFHFSSIKEYLKLL